MVLLSNIELYFTPSENISADVIALCGDEFKHAIKVMRNGMHDIIYITDGVGSIFKAEIIVNERERLSAKIIEIIKSKNRLKNIFFCIPKLKNPDRFKFALEKCVELGIVNFIVFESERTISKSINIKRWEKIALSAMKQSIRSHQPNIELVSSFSEIVKLPGEKIVFDQNALKNFSFKNDRNKNYYFIFGPEGGLTDDELKLFDSNSVYTLATNRLRTETAIVKAAASL